MKKIVYNKSTLVSLKAELLRKQEEVNEKKQLPQHRLVNFKPPSSNEKAKPSSNEKGTKKTFKDSLKAVDVEELEASRRSRLALEKKAELYEHLADSSGRSELEGRFLVDFNTKKQQDHDCEQNGKHHEDIEDSNCDDGWVEFTDCLGRTRKCIKSDLEYFMKRDKLLHKDLTKEGDAPDEDRCQDVVEENNKQQMPFLVQKTNDYLQSLREKWEQKEKELLGKDKDIHYQDLLFDEARIHGVGYYAFSTDETERRKQMEELTRQRGETLRAQQETEQLRKKRDELVAARLAAARARQRARQGLPPEPEPPADNQKDFTTCLLEFLTQQKNEADKKAKEEEKKAKEEQEKERQKLREAHIREWDMGKEGMGDKIKKFREMTQEEYVEQQRSKRIKEFAPPQALSGGRSEVTFDEGGRSVGPKTWSDVRPKVKTPPPPDIRDVIVNEEQKGLYFSTSTKSNPQMKYTNFVKSQDPIQQRSKRIKEFAPPQALSAGRSDVTFDESGRSVGSTTRFDVRPKVKTPPQQPDISDFILNEEQKGLYFSTSTKSNPQMKYKNFVKTQEPIPIENELSDPDDDNVHRSEQGKISSNHVEIEPPPTYDYYGPTPKYSRTEKPFKSDIREAYAQGAESLKHKSNDPQLSKQYDFTFD